MSGAFVSSLAAFCCCWVSEHLGVHLDSKEMQTGSGARTRAGTGGGIRNQRGGAGVVLQVEQT